METFLMGYQWPMCSVDTRAIEAYVAFFYITPSYIIYAISMIVVIVYKKSDFQGPFHTILIINGVMELLDYPLNFLGRRATNIPEFFSLFKGLPHTGLLISLWHGYIQYSVTIRYILAVFLSYVRFCIIVFPRRSDHFCLLHSKVTPIENTLTVIEIFLAAIFVSFTVPWFAIWPYVAGSFIEEAQTRSGHWYASLDYDHTVFLGVRTSPKIIIILSCTCSLCFLFNLLAIIGLFRSQQMITVSQKTTYKREKLLMIFTIFVSIFQLYLLLTQLLYNYRNSYDSVEQTLFINCLQFFGYDASLVFSAWFLILSSRALRRRLKADFKKYVLRKSESQKSLVKAISHHQPNGTSSRKNYNWFSKEKDNVQNNIIRVVT